MSGADLGYFAALGLVFAIWAFVWFRALFGLKRIADARRRALGISYFTGIGITLSVFAEFLSAPEHRAQRRQVLVWTALIFALILFRLWTLRG